MSIYHDAYLFSAAEFKQFLQDHMPSGKDKDRYWNQLSELTLSFAKDPFVHYLGDIYGSWDYEGLKQEFTDEKGDLPYLAQHSFMIFLYKYLAQCETHPDGLGDHWRDVESIAILPEKLRQAIIYGYPFNNLLKHEQLSESVLTSLSKAHIAPYSTGSWAGYLTHKHVTSLSSELKNAHNKLEETSPYYITINKALKMLQTAINAKTGLCLIASG